MDELRAALIRLTTDSQPSEELPGLAAQALSVGVDVPALRELAPLGRADVRESRDLFLQAMEQLGVTVPRTRRESVQFWAKEIVEGALSPAEGARLIFLHGYIELGNPEDLLPFVALWSEWDDDPEHRPEYERDIVAAARRLIGSATA